MNKQFTISGENDFSYQIIWENDYKHLSNSVKELHGDWNKICIVADSNVAPLYGEQVKEALKDLPVDIDLFVFPAGEESKNLETVNNLYRFLIEKQYTRKDLLAALGGGVTGDLTGFAAATYLRGIDFIQLPTTLLAQVDSSMGGKTGVDVDGYKNMAGAFYHPRCIYMNMETLKTLPDKEFQSGMGEVLKSGLIYDGSFYEWIIEHMWEIQEKITPVLQKMVRTCCKIKMDIVEKDPKEDNIRAILNFGHTIGHGIEKTADFTLPHGHCVALGSVAAAYISFQRGYLTEEEFYEVRDMNVGFDLPIFFDGLNPEDILKATKSDKKMDHGQIRFVLLKTIGEAVVDHTVTEEELRKAIKFINGDVINENEG